jgi:hypothetical protein
MTNAHGPLFEATEADVAEQRIPVDVSDDHTELEIDRVRISPDLDASEADLIEQAMAVPLSDDDEDFSR